VGGSQTKALPVNWGPSTWDVPFVEWAERAGYAIDYCANLDLHFHPNCLVTTVLPCTMP
jgi:hypothetical protein